jgi:hypothetical protein
VSDRIEVLKLETEEGREKLSIYTTCLPSGQDQTFLETLMHRKGPKGPFDIKKPKELYVAFQSVLAACVRMRWPFTQRASRWIIRSGGIPQFQLAGQLLYEEA